MCLGLHWVEKTCFRTHSRPTFLSKLTARGQKSALDACWRVHSCLEMCWVMFISYFWCPEHIKWGLRAPWTMQPGSSSSYNDVHSWPSGCGTATGAERPARHTAARQGGTCHQKMLPVRLKWPTMASHQPENGPKWPKNAQKTIFSRTFFFGFFHFFRFFG